MKLSFPKRNRTFHILYLSILFADILLLTLFALRLHNGPTLWDVLTLCFAGVSFLGALAGETVLLWERREIKNSAE
ncbi:hypothetical protein [Zongyangia hominis]|uniref:Uncharacterized protein n=1 Tax=Zongyangia hominis TaxID=2763677 RepID=A0A926E9M0_9FIRM|nr:hypothetical protein [Zongyangia hominis]MBC8569743.1 hypothetical protein [Zongyangia hominis]